MIVARLVRGIAAVNLTIYAIEILSVFAERENEVSAIDDYLLSVYPSIADRLFDSMYFGWALILLIVAYLGTTISAHVGYLRLRAWAGHHLIISIVIGLVLFFLVLRPRALVPYLSWGVSMLLTGMLLAFWMSAEVRDLWVRRPSLTAKSPPEPKC